MVWWRGGAQQNLARARLIDPKSCACKINRGHPFINLIYNCSEFSHRILSPFTKRLICSLCLKYCMLVCIVKSGTLSVTSSPVEIPVFTDSLYWQQKGVCYFTERTHLWRREKKETTQGQTRDETPSFWETCIFHPARGNVWMIFPSFAIIAPCHCQYSLCYSHLTRDSKSSAAMTVSSVDMFSQLALRVHPDTQRMSHVSSSLSFECHSEGQSC